MCFNDVLFYFSTFSVFFYTAIIVYTIILYNSFVVKLVHGCVIVCLLKVCNAQMQFQNDSGDAVTVN